MRRLLAELRFRRTSTYRKWRVQKPVCESVPISGLVSDPEGEYCPRPCVSGCVAAAEYDRWMAARPVRSDS